MLIRVTPDVLDPMDAARAVETPRSGAVNVFLGNVRDHNLGREVDHLYYDAYPAMAEKVLRELAAEAIDRYGLDAVAVLHRTGRLAIGETSLVVAVSHGHRKPALDASLWLVDELKRKVPIWKKEVWADGEEWIEAPESLAGRPAPATMR